MTIESNSAMTTNIKCAQELTLSDNHLRHCSFIDNNVDGTWRLDLEAPIRLDLPAIEQVELLYRYGYFAEANQALADQYGFDKPAEMIGFRLEEFMPRDLPTSIPRIIQVVESNYRMNAWESIEQDRYGNRKVFLNNLLGEIKNGKLLRVWGTAKDITHQKRLEEETRLRSAVFEQIPDGCVIVEATSEKVIYLNAAFTKITGYTVSDIPGKKLSFLQGADTDPNTVSQIREAIAQKQLFQGEILNYKKDGTPFWNLMQISPIKDTQGVVTHYVGIVSDITEHKRIQQKLHEQRDHLTHIARVNAVGECNAMLAHELNQPLTAILSNAQAALRFLDQENPDVGEVREILKDIVADDKRARDVVYCIRHLVKRDGGRFERLHINHLIEEVYVLMSKDLAIKQVKYNTRLAPNLPELHGDPVQLQQVILNLVMNACQAVQALDSDNRQITVSTRDQDNQAIELTVTNSGHGIDEKMLEHIFQPFFTTKQEGMGMGLSISRTIIEAHGGRLWAENSPDQGAVFRVILPIAP